MFWTRFSELCAEKGKAPGNIAAKIGVSTSNVAAWKKGVVPREPVVEKLAEQLGVLPEYLLGKTDIKKAPSREEAEAEILKIMQYLPAEQRRMVEDYALFLLHKQKGV